MNSGMLHRTRGIAVAVFLGMVWWGIDTVGQPSAGGQPLRGSTPGVVDLAGQWYAAEGDSMAWSGGRFDDSSWQRVELPASWSRLQAEGGLDTQETKLWFRRTLQLPGDWRRSFAPNGLALSIGAGYYGAYDVYAGGAEIGSHRSEGSIPAPRIQLFRIPDHVVDDDGRLVLALAYEPKVWSLNFDFSDTRGPVGESILMGDLETLRQIHRLGHLEAQHARLPFLALAAFIGVSGLYHFQLFIARRRLAAHLWFAALAIIGTGYILLIAFGFDWFESLWVRRRGIGVLTHLSVAAALGFVGALLGRPLLFWERLYQRSHLAIAAGILLVPAGTWIDGSQMARSLYSLPVLAWFTLLILRHGFERRREERFVSFMTALFVGSMALEALAGIIPLKGAFPWAAYTLAALGAALAVAVSNRLSEAQGELQRLRGDLELRVEEGTEELAQANRRLRSEVAERQLVEEAMRMLERAVEQSADGIAVMDLSGSTHFINAAWAEMHGHDVYDVLGYEISLFHTPDQMQNLVYPLMAQVRNQGSFAGEVGHRRKDGSTFPTWMSVTLLQETKGPVGMVAIARDISDRRQAAEEQLRLEKKAQQAEKLESLAILASGIAHDYNNLLTGLLGNTGLLLRELPDGSLERVRVGQIEDAAERAAQLSDQLLAYAGEDQIAPVTTLMNDLIADVRPNLERLVPQGTLLQFQLKEGLPPVEIDRRQIGRILQQLVANAIESIEGVGEGVVTVRTSMVDADHSYFEGAFFDQGKREGRYVFVEVSDSGSGIDDATKARMFDPFFSTKGTGRGLGLASTLGLVRAHGGAIKVYTQKGRGTTFEVLFPVSSGEPEAAVDSVEIEGWRGRGVVLVVDDEELVREVTQDILEGHGFDVLSAADGREALEIFEQRSAEIDAVILDLTMPNVDGEEAFRRMRARDPAVKILLMSGYSQKRARKRLEGEGLAGFLHKPFRPDELVHLLRTILE